MENMDKGLTVPKWVLINQPKIPQMSQNLSVQIVCVSPKIWNFDEKRLHWASVVLDRRIKLKEKLEMREAISRLQFGSFKITLMLMLFHEIIYCTMQQFMKMRMLLQNFLTSFCNPKQPLFDIKSVH